MSTSTLITVSKSSWSGARRTMKQIADELIGVKGVKHGKLVMTTTGQELL
jgi:metal-responsive CopG/Arc/MetJ family transcriptional regulator